MQHRIILSIQGFAAQFFAALALIMSHCGCSNSDHSSYDSMLNGEERVWSITKDRQLINHFGTVLSGTTVRHKFLVKNDSLETYSLLEGEAGIVLNCGCSAITPERRSLGPGEQMYIEVKVNTSGKNGESSNGGTLNWRTLQGADLRTSVSLQENIVFPITCEPESLVFSKEDVLARTPKRITFRQRVPVKWDSFNLQIAGNGLAVSDVVKGKDFAYCDVTANCEKNTESFEGKILGRINLASADAMESTSLYLTQACRK